MRTNVNGNATPGDSGEGEKDRAQRRNEAEERREESLANFRRSLPFSVSLRRCAQFRSPLPQSPGAPDWEQREGQAQLTGEAGLAYDHGPMHREVAAEAGRGDGGRVGVDGDGLGLRPQ